MIGAAPYMHIVPRTQQVGGLRRRRFTHMVLLHLIQMNARLFNTEEASPDLRQLDIRMCQFPIVVRVPLDGAAQHAAQQLVPEADPAEQHLLPLLPQVLEQLDKLLDPFVVAVSVLRASRDQDRGRVLGYPFGRGNVPGVFGAVFHHVMHLRLDSKWWVMLQPCSCE